MRRRDEPVGDGGVRGEVPAHERPRLVDAARVGHVLGVADAEHRALGREARLDEVEVARLAAALRAHERLERSSAHGAPTRRAAASIQVTSPGSHVRPRAAEHLRERGLGARRGPIDDRRLASTASKQPAASTKGTGRALERHQARVQRAACARPGPQCAPSPVDRGGRAFDRSRPSRVPARPRAVQFRRLPGGRRRQPSCRAMPRGCTCLRDISLHAWRPGTCYIVCTMPRRLRVVGPFAALFASSWRVACASPTLPLPPPEAPTQTAGPDADHVKLSAACGGAEGGAAHHHRQPEPAACRRPGRGRLDRQRLRLLGRERPRPQRRRLSHHPGSGHRQRAARRLSGPEPG